MKDKVNARTNGLERNVLNNYPANITFSAFLDTCPPCAETLSTNGLVKHVRELLDWVVAQSRSEIEVSERNSNPNQQKDEWKYRSIL